MGAIMHADQSLSSFYDYESVVDLKSALRSCNPSLLLDVLLDTEAGWGFSYRDIGDAAKESLLEKLSSTIALMQSVGKKEPGFGLHAHDASGYPLLGEETPDGHSKLIVPFESFEVSDDGVAFVRRLNARILDCSKLDEAMKVIQSVGGKVNILTDESDISTFEKGIDPYEMAIETGILEDIDGLEDESWSDALQYNIWLPHTYCERERYCILANVFWVITYNGFFGDAAEKILGSCTVVPASNEALASFDERYKQRLHKIASLLNYNGWVDSVETLFELCKAA